MNKRLFIAVFICFLIFFSGAQAEEKETVMQNPFGALEFFHWNHSWNSFKYPSQEELLKSIKLMKEAGIGIVRFDFLWAEIEPEEGKFDFSKYDEIVDLVTQNGLVILGIFDYSAPWAAECGDWNCPPRRNETFINYAVKTVEHFKSRVKYWEVWNEPDSQTYWKTQDGLKRYCELLKEVYAAVKRVDPDCKVLNGGLANGLSSINKLYDNGAQGYFDILNIHIFDTPLNENSIKAVKAYPRLARKLMLRKGDAQKRIWITEIGCPGVKPKINTGNWWLGKNPTECQQAAWVQMVYTELLKDKNIEKIFWAFFRDCQDHWNNGIDYFGLVRWDFSKKPGFSAYKSLFKKWRRSRE
jgi:hypothetical protein